MKAYKGFDKNMQCRGFQYEEGKTYETGSAKLCESGFHACLRPIDVLNHYAPASSVYHEVELEDVSEERDSNDSKVCGKKITIGAALDVADLVKAQIDYVKANTTTANTDPKTATAGDRGAATAGDSGAATAGDRGAATASDRGAATAGDWGAATAGDRGAATAGDWGAATASNSGAATAGNSGAATAGDWGAATAGDSGTATAGCSGIATASDRGTATAGYRGVATAGDRGNAISRGKAHVGENGVCISRGNDVQVRGGIGSILVIAEESDDDCKIVDWKAEIVDGERIKADSWYRLENGEFVEA